MEMRHLAVALRSDREAEGIRPDLDFDAILDRLCWLALECGASRPGTRLEMDEWLDEMLDSGLNLLSAATYFSCVSEVKDLLEQGYDPMDCDDCPFPSPIYIAAWTGQATMFELMQERLPEYDELDFGYPGFYTSANINENPSPVRLFVETWI